ncbi:hypothetical protein SKAU_G00348600 [Synaphobranchus kaupii]|uniref:Metalloendopeptidase n=1 Tax=Synaphobranchus kaupii TaxID=118154 RepID=A0A9Q1EK19_SYNKA|nr:hypothetical protein SKAU_G00348600 [Synaphobranchus kaupii]
MSRLLVFTFAFMVLCAVHCYPSEGSSDISAEQEDNPIYDKSLKDEEEDGEEDEEGGGGEEEEEEGEEEAEESDVSTLLEKANKNVGQALDEPTVIGDIAVPTDLGNAEPCTAHRCRWRKSKNGKVYVPYVISKRYTRRERCIIKHGMRAIAHCTCIRFRRRRRQRDFLKIQSRSGCYSFVGRRGGGQVLSLNRHRCVRHKIVQHQLLHALGFYHEQQRSDRDRHVCILYKNIIPGRAKNFRKIITNNLGTPYDYNSIMHYGRYAFSKNGKPTIVPIPNRYVAIGKAKKLSRIDIIRINRLYGCGRSE